MLRGEPLSQAAPDSSPIEGSLWRNRSLCGDCQGLSYKERWHRVSDDGEVVLRQSLSSVGKSGSPHRFLYLFAEVYDILVLRFIPPILLGKGGETNDPHSHNLGVCRGKYNFTLYLQVA